VTAILSASVLRDDIINSARLPDAEVNLDLASRTPVGPTVHLSAGSDIGAAVWANPDSDIVCEPGFYPAFQLRKPPGHGYSRVRPDVSMLDRRYTPSDRASGIQVTDNGGATACWNDSQTPGQIPYKITLQGVHPITSENSQPNFFFGAAMLAAEQVSRIQDLPYDIVLDRCVHFVPASSWRRWSFLANGVSIGGVNCWFDGAHYLNWPSGVDSQGLGHYQGPGPFTFEDTFVVGAEETHATGNTGNGGLWATKTRMRNLVLRRCHVYRYKAARGILQCKRSIELKQAEIAYYKDCIIENSHPDVQQVGTAMFGWSGQEEDYGATSDIVMENCWFKSVAGIAEFTPMYQGRANVPFKRATIRNCVATAFSDPTYCSRPSGGSFHDTAFSFLSNLNNLGVSQGVNDILIEHTMVFTRGNGINELFRVHPVEQRNLRIRNNIMGIGPGGVFGSGRVLACSSGDGQTGWDLIAGPGSSWNNNAVVDPLDGASRVNVGSNGNQYRSTIAGLGLTRAATLDDAAVHTDLATLALSPSSTIRGTGSGGVDPGPDFSVLVPALAGVRADVP
jgi:hypothetical protein